MMKGCVLPKMRIFLAKILRGSFWIEDLYHRDYSPPAKLYPLSSSVCQSEITTTGTEIFSSHQNMALCLHHLGRKQKLLNGRKKPNKFKKGCFSHLSGSVSLCYLHAFVKLSFNWLAEAGAERRNFGLKMNTELKILCFSFIRMCQRDSDGKRHRNGCYFHLNLPN